MPPLELDYGLSITPLANWKLSFDITKCCYIVLFLASRLSGSLAVLQRRKAEYPLEQLVEVGRIRESDSAADSLHRQVRRLEQPAGLLETTGGKIVDQAAACFLMKIRET